MTERYSTEAGDSGVTERFNFTRDVVERLAGEHLSRSALTFIDSEGVIERLTFAEVATRSARWAGLFRELGVVPGDRILVSVDKRPDWHEIMLASLKIGAVAVPCSKTLASDELQRRVRETAPVLVVVDESSREHLSGVDDAPPVLRVDEAASLLPRQSAVAATHETTMTDPAFILYTSGTTGASRAVLHSHAFCSAQALQARRWLGAARTDSVWCTMELGWSKAIWNVLLGPWSRGAEVVVDEGAFDPAERLELIQRLRVTILCQSPDEYRELATRPEVRTALAGTRRVVSAGERLDPSLVAAFHDASGHLIRDGYGQTETMLVIGQLVGTPLRPGTIGVALPELIVAVIDSHGRTLPPGEEGDLALFGRAPGLFAGYWNEPDETVAAFRGDWYLTGDRASRDEDGYFTLVGRVDDVVAAGTDRVNPLVIERALAEDAAVAEVAVVSAPDAGEGPAVTAYVVLGPRRRPTNSLVQRLTSQAAKSSEQGVALAGVEFVSELPKTANGKIRRLELRNRELERAGLPAEEPRARPTEEPEPADDALLLDEPALIVAALEIRERERKAAEQQREAEERAIDEEQERLDEDEQRRRRRAERDAARSATRRGRPSNEAGTETPSAPSDPPSARRGKR